MDGFIAKVIDFKLKVIDFKLKVIDFKLKVIDFKQIIAYCLVNAFLSPIAIIIR